MRVEIEMKNGRRTKVQPVIAQHLQSRGLATVIGEMPAEGSYQTRAMAPQTTRAMAPQTTRAMAPQTTRGSVPRAEPEVDLDSQGVAWSADLHTPEKIKNSNGAWRKKSGRPTSDPA